MTTRIFVPRDAAARAVGADRVAAATSVPRGVCVPVVANEALAPGGARHPAAARVAGPPVRVLRCVTMLLVLLLLLLPLPLPLRLLRLLILLLVLVLVLALALSLALALVLVSLHSAFLHVLILSIYCCSLLSTTYQKA